MKRRLIVIAIVLASLLAACDRVIDLSRTGGGVDAPVGSDGGSGTDGGIDGIPDDGGGGASDVGSDL